MRRKVLITVAGLLVSVANVAYASYADRVASQSACDGRACGSPYDCPGGCQCMSLPFVPWTCQGW